MRSRDIFFRGISEETNELVYGSFISGINGDPMITYFEQTPPTMQDPLGDSIRVYDGVKKDSVTQYTGFKDKKGNLIFAGDYIIVKVPERNVWTHTGDNIPHGSYSEPGEALISSKEYLVEYANGSFGFEENGIFHPLFYLFYEHTLDSIKSAIEYPTREIFYNEAHDKETVEELHYLMEEHELNNYEELLDYVNGVIIVGNIYEDEDDE